MDIVDDRFFNPENFLKLIRINILLDLNFFFITIKIRIKQYEKNIIIVKSIQLAPNWFETKSPFNDEDACKIIA